MRGTKAIDDRQTRSKTPVRRLSPRFPVFIHLLNPSTLAAIGDQADFVTRGGYVDHTPKKKHPQSRPRHSSSWDSWTRTQYPVRRSTYGTTYCLGLFLMRVDGSLPAGCDCSSVPPPRLRPQPRVSRAILRRTSEDSPYLRDPFQVFHGG